MANQWVKSVFPTENAPLLETKTPASRATEAGANVSKKRRGACKRLYNSLANHATFRRYRVSADLLVEVLA